MRRNGKFKTSPHFCGVTPWVRLRRNKLAMAGGIFIISWALAAIFAPLITPYGFARQDLTAILQKPQF